ncbi:PREDICTED: B3 domain-containing protein At5g18090-like [Fragaria vesca subsp. vesca]|uniref:B3 domain-containing protein At5g18090-like n=1 Tax=Fragaria vesca subsp. vesca TaxID=101020 RepID=UPI0002C2ED8A|nr:PREDICTED: B3 domain-containing protein At5g18090-like [Fragaria vesca subsp. vesca]
MASSSSSLAEKEKGHGVSEEDSPAFCLRIFSREDLKDGKKELPPAAVREYGHQMADHMFLKVPNCGEHWKIELRTSPRRDRMWLEKGWEEFASFYLLDQGDMATFSFEGEHSHFHVSIYSWDDMEIEYPIRSGGAGVSTPERKEIGTEAVAIASSLSHRSSVAVRGKDKVRRRRRRQTGFEAEARAISVSSRCSADEHEYDTSQMSSFRSDKPFLDIRIPAKHLSCRVFINHPFATEHFYKADTCCDVMLQNIQGDRAWTIQCTSYKRSNGRIEAIISGTGWRAFRQDNHLEEGDICVLEVIEERKCRVLIFRAKK